MKFIMDRSNYSYVDPQWALLRGRSVRARRSELPSFVFGLFVVYVAV